MDGHLEQHPASCMHQGGPEAISTVLGVTFPGFPLCLQRNQLQQSLSNAHGLQSHAGN